MNDLQSNYRLKLDNILRKKIDTKIKMMLMQNLISELKETIEIGRTVQYDKNRNNCDTLSTSISQCCNSNYIFEKDIEQLEDKIIKLRLMKIENNQEIQTCEEELFEMEKIAKARSEFNDHLKQQIQIKMEMIQIAEHFHAKKIEKKEEKYGINQSLNAVAGVLKLARWWN